MRALHWWGAAVAVGVLAASASSASPAFAGNGQSQQASRADRSSVHVRVAHGREYVHGRDHDDHGNEGHGRDGHGHPCPYPPNGTPSVAVSGPGWAHLNEWVGYTGKVSLNRCTYDGVATAMYASLDGRRHWWKVGEAVTDKNGCVTYGTSMSTPGRYHLVVVVGAAGGLNAAYSDQFDLQVAGGRGRH